MKHLLFAATLLAVIGLNVSAVSGQAKQTDSAKQARRMSLMQAARAINVTEVDQQEATGQFADWKTLAESEVYRKNGVNLPVLTSVRVFVDTDGTHFSVAVADTTDPCLYTVFSNETGVLYEGLTPGCKTK